ncbi:uncharacterized protein Dmoj_GI25845 [Drosophila mojavensis]|uniref:Uncharacterized protein n=1 Tax=Drosophila mojavensis TaxID=7230 RepID=A0A0Q9X9J5_DROMO|nr:uncharacterized protein Dmoj_GI25845 [Drosophila mojavensis]
MRAPIRCDSNLERVYLATDTHFIVMPRSLSSSRENFIQHVFTICQDHCDFNDNFDFIVGYRICIKYLLHLPCG